MDKLSVAEKTKYHKLSKAEKDKFDSLPDDMSFSEKMKKCSESANTPMRVKGPY